MGWDYDNFNKTFVLLISCTPSDNNLVVDVERSYDKPWLSSSKKVKAKSEDFSASKQGKKTFLTKDFFFCYHVIL